jgi:hypothetical protein
MSPLQIKILNLHNNGMSMRAMSRHLGIARQNINTYCKKLGIAGRHMPIVSPNQYSINKFFFDSIDTIEKAYWLGFILADGNINTTKDNCTHRLIHRMLRVRLQSQDASHLQKFSDAIGYDGPVKIYDKFHRKTGKTYSASGVFMCCTHICTALINAGWYGFKRDGDTLILDNVNDSLKRYLVRGLFDGDGGLSFKKGKYNATKAAFSFHDLHKSVVEWVCLYLIQKLELNYPVIHKPNESFSFEWGGNKQVRKILSFLYSGSGPVLDRKYIKYNKIGIRYTEYVMEKNHATSTA